MKISSGGYRGAHFIYSSCALNATVCTQRDSFWPNEYLVAISRNAFDVYTKRQCALNATGFGPTKVSR